MRVLQLPRNTPYVRKLSDAPRFRSANGCRLRTGEAIPDLVTFKWVWEHRGCQSFWDSFDILHIHFGFEFESATLVAQALELVLEHSKPIVYTCHEFNSVHGNENYEAYLALILGCASETICLTDTASQELSLRYALGRPPHVIPHGYVLSPQSQWFCGGLAMKKPTEILLYSSLRHNRDLATTTINLLMNAVTGTNTTLLTHPFSSRQLAEIPGLGALLPLALASPYGSVELRLPMTDDELAKEMCTKDILVLPYLDAGHSGSLEMAYDLGLYPVITPVGHLASQYAAWPKEGVQPGVVVSVWSDEIPNLFQSRLIEAIRLAVDTVGDFKAQIDPKERRAFRISEHAAILGAHERVYRACLAAL